MKTSIINGSEVSRLSVAIQFIIETMGYESEEYLERKRQMHRWMEQEGVLLTDPPGWPGPSEKTFNSYLLKYIFGAGKTRE